MLIKIKVIKAILTHNTQIGSEMDPFVVLKIGTDQQKGKTFQQAGDMPQFNEQFDFNITNNQTTLHLIVYDEDTTVDDLVGELKIDTKPMLLQALTQKKWYSLKYNGKKPAGKIMLEFQCKNEGLKPTSKQYQINQIMKPNLHPIGLQQQQVRMNPTSISNRQYFSRYQHQPQYVQNQIILNPETKGTNNSQVFSFQTNCPINYQNPMQQSYNSTYVSNMSNRSYLSNNSSRSNLPLNNGNIYLNNSNMYQIYQQPKTSSSTSITSPKAPKCYFMCHKTLNNLRPN